MTVVRCAGFALLIGIGAAASGCYRTRVRAGMPVGPTMERRQWFTLGGFVGLSDPVGVECGSTGVAVADSRLAGNDILINVALGLAGGLVGVVACPLDDDPSNTDARGYGSCVSATAALVPFLVGSRTVTYQCSGGPTTP
jgi:hypothetical protein